MKKVIKLLTLLMAVALAGYGCGQGPTASAPAVTGDAGAGDAAGMEKTAKVSLSYTFPSEDAQKALISDSATHILVTVKQWLTDDLNNLTVVNRDKALITRPASAASLDLYPTWTRICASQWKGDPNDSMTSQRLETACTFGKLQPGLNNIGLTLLRGEWTLTLPFNGVASVALSRNNAAGSYYSYYGEDARVGDVYDGEPQGDPFAMPTQAFNNWGSIYQAMFKKDLTYQFLVNGGAAYSNTFDSANSYLPNLLIGSGEEVEIIGDGIGDDDGICEDGYWNVVTNVWVMDEDCEVKGFVIGGFAKKTDIIDNVFREEKNIIDFEEYRTNQRDPGCSYEYWGDGFLYTCYRTRLASGKAEMTIADKNGTNTTSTIVDPCQVRITLGNNIQGCAGTHQDVVMGDYTTFRMGATTAPFANYSVIRWNYKVDAKLVTKGADVCLKDNNAAKDANGNLICVNRDYFSRPVYACTTAGMTYDYMKSLRCEVASASGGLDCSPNYYDSVENVCYNYLYSTTYTYTCYEGGTYNIATGRCEMSLKVACTGEPTWSDYCPTCYDAATQTCTETDTGYLNKISLTPVTMTGVNKLPASTGVTPSSKERKNTIKW